MKKCPKCGTENPDNAKECSSCLAILDPEKEKRRNLGKISIVVLVIDLIIWTVLTVSCGFVTSTLSEMYIEFKVNIPIVTRMSHYVFVMGAIALVAKEWWKNKLATLWINILAFFPGTGILVGIYLWALYLPMPNMPKL